MCHLQRAFAGCIIKSLLIANCVAWTALFIVACVEEEVWVIIVTGLLMVFWVLYTWCVWARVAFSTALLKVASKITGSYKGTICVAMSVVVLNII